MNRDPEEVVVVLVFRVADSARGAEVGWWEPEVL